MLCLDLSSITTASSCLARIVQWQRHKIFWIGSMLLVLHIQSLKQANFKQPIFMLSVSCSVECFKLSVFLVEPFEFFRNPFLKRCIEKC